VSTPTSQSPLRWHTLFIALLTIGLLALFFSRLDLRQTWSAITRAHWAYIFAAILTVLSTNIVRAWRWIALLQPLGPVRFRTAFRTTVIGFMAIALLPARIGDVLRAYLLARREGLVPASTFATVIVERLLDLVTVLLLFAVALAFAGVDVGERTRFWSLAIALVAVVGLAVLFILAGHPERLGRSVAWLIRHLPARFAQAANHFARTFSEGLAVLRSPGHLAVAMLWSLPVWISIAGGIWLTSRAFDLTFSFVGSFLVVGYLTIGVAFPTPGGAGGFHAFYLLALTQFFGADADTAGAAAIMLHAVSFVPVSVLGLVFMWQDGLTLGGLQGMRQEVRAAGEP
jgi:glycosyltransferase 2 family protein